MIGGVTEPWRDWSTITEIISTDSPPCECWPTDDDAHYRARQAARPEAVRALRRGLRRWLAEHVLDEDTAEAVLLLADEAVTNAVEHAVLHHPCTVELVAGTRACGGGVAVLVRDDGTWRPPPDDSGFRGRGVTLMGRMADRSTITASEHGTTVRMCWAVTA